MKKFKFKLATVLSLREHKERLVMQEVAALNGERVRVEDVISGIDGETTAVEDSLAERLESGMNGAQLLAVEGYLETLAMKRVAEEKHLAQVHTHLGVKRQELTKRALERKTMESLKDRQKEAFYQEMEEKQRKLDDETALVHRAAIRSGR